MIRELSDLGKRIRKQKTQNEWAHDALKEETISLVLTIKPDGSFVSLESIERKKTVAEAVQRTSGKESRLLIDNCGYVLGVYDDESNAFKKKVEKKGEKKTREIFKEDVAEKFDLFLKRLDDVDKLDALKPVLNFYKENKHKGIDIVNQEYFLKTIHKKDRGGNISLLVLGQSKYVHEYDSLYRKIIDAYEVKQQKLISGIRRKCAVCGGVQFPVGDFTHFPIKRVPGDQEPAGGRKLISYNGDNNPFESYGMVGNENCMICTNCAKTYVEGLNWLLSTGPRAVSKSGKAYIAYTNRKNFGPDRKKPDTAMVFWTRENKHIEEMDLLDAPDPQTIGHLIESVVSGSDKESRYIETDQFYSCTLSGAAARVAVRDWIETSLIDFRKAIAKWFQDIAIDYKSETYYPRLYELARSCQRKIKNENNEKYDEKDVTFSRIATYLWNAALKNGALPWWMLATVLKRVRLDKQGVTRERAALIKLILNRNNRGGGFMVPEKLVEGNKPVAYVCGQIFAALESIQRAALGKNIGAGIRERYFTFALTAPSPAFGRLFNLSSKHFTKLKGEKPGLAVVLDKELQELCKGIKIEKFPSTFRLEEQGQFAIGYYHQKNNWKNDPKLKETVEEDENESSN